MSLESSTPSVVPCPLCWANDGSRRSFRTSRVLHQRPHYQAGAPVQPLRGALPSPWRQWFGRLEFYTPALDGGERSLLRRVLGQITVTNERFVRMAWVLLWISFVLGQGPAKMICLMGSEKPFNWGWHSVSAEDWADRPDVYRDIVGSRVDSDLASVARSWVLAVISLACYTFAFGVAIALLDEPRGRNRLLGAALLVCCLGLLVFGVTSSHSSLGKKTYSSSARSIRLGGLSA